MIQRTLFLALLLTWSPALWAQRPGETPVRAESVTLLSGRTASVSFPRLEPGRLYRVRVILESQTAPSDDGWIEVKGAASQGLTGRLILSRMNPVTAVSVTAKASESPALTLTAGGAPGESYRVRVEWQAVPMARMPGVTFTPSPNQNARPANVTVTAIVVHATVGPTLQGNVNWFLTPRSQVSAHYLVAQDGTIVQMVEDTARAWHAGVSELEGVRGVNDFSIGIEIVNRNDGVDPYTDAQYASLAAIIRHVREQYWVPDSRIISHEAVARPPGRKNDPKGFDFQRLLRMLREP
jgi:N-acetylmuramoyl-L-alanine amidase